MFKHRENALFQKSTFLLFFAVLRPASPLKGRCYSKKVFFYFITQLLEILGVSKACSADFITAIICLIAIVVPELLQL